MKLIVKSAAVGMLTLLFAVIALAQAKPQKPKPVPNPALEQQRLESFKGLKPPSGPSFYITPVEGSAGMFSLLLTDGAGNTVSGVFTLKQIDVFQAVLEAAKAFALTDEKVGSAAPITTRLMEQHEWSLFVDVSKTGNQSRFYVSLVTLQGKLTAEAGEITRGSKKEPSALFLKILAQIQDARAGAKPSQ